MRGGNRSAASRAALGYVCGKPRSRNIIFVHSSSFRSSSRADDAVQTNASEGERCSPLIFKICQRIQRLASISSPKRIAKMSCAFAYSRSALLWQRNPSAGEHQFAIMYPFRSRVAFRLTLKALQTRYSYVRAVYEGQTNEIPKNQRKRKELSRSEPVVGD